MRPRALRPCLVLLALAALGCGDRSPEVAASPPPPQAPSPARQRQAPAPRPERQGWVGVVIARDSVDVTVETQGRLRAVYVQIGDAVRAGAPIASLDPQLAAQDLEMARAALRATEADASRASEELAEARVRAERRRSNPELFSKEELAEVELRVKTAAAALEMSRARASEQRARVRQLEAVFGQTEIRAPFAGRVAERFVDPGAVVGPGTALVRLISSEDLLVRSAVPPEEVRKLAEGARVVVAARGSGTVVPGVVERIAPEVDTASQRVFIEVRLETGGLQTGLQTGQVVDVRPAESAA